MRILLFLIFFPWSISAQTVSPARLKGWWQCVSLKHGSCMFAGFQFQDNQFRFFCEQNDQMNVILAKSEFLIHEKQTIVKFSKQKNEANPSAKLPATTCNLSLVLDTLWIEMNDQKTPFIKVKPDFPSARLKGIWEPVEKILPNQTIAPPPISFVFMYKPEVFWNDGWVTEDLFQRKAQWAYIPFLDKILVREQASQGIWNIDLIKLESNELIISEFMHFGPQAKIKFQRKFSN